MNLHISYTNIIVDLTIYAPLGKEYHHLIYTHIYIYIHVCVYTYRFACLLYI